MSGAKALVLFAIGFGSGAMLTLFAANALRATSSYPQALMGVQQAQLGVLRRAAKASECQSNQARQANEILISTARDIERAFYANTTVPTEFRERANALRAELGKLSSVADCREFSAAVGKVAQSCDSCHQSFRY